ncbi:MAG: GNAT family N-acetyltransferase, partial [Planctomycetia bacterium]|nr:GNAT family N-acetyltransferase [Planctomycetia bacterium]
DRAVIDGFGDMPTRDITRLLVAVGFSSPPSWIKPYAVLSGGEKFRCDLARALAAGVAETAPVVAFDEFTSVVDRNVARVGSAAVARAIRRGQVRVRFVAISCHYDIARWLEPDWVLDMARGVIDANLDRRRLRRPPVRLELFRCHHAAWQLFASHHYLSGSLSRSARCFLATWEDMPVGFCATLPVIGRRDHWRITRLVTLPDYQGIGIGMQLAEAVAELHAAAGHRLNVTASHPGLLMHCRRSPRWRTARVLRTGSRRSGAYRPNYFGSPGRAVVSFEFVGGSQPSAGQEEVLD